MRQEAGKHPLEPHQFRLAVGNGHHVHAEGDLQIGILVEHGEDLLRIVIALDLDDGAQSLPVALVADIVNARERNLFLRGLVPLIGYQTDSVYYNRDKRFAGESKYPFRKMLNFAIDGITSFSVKPVRMIFWIGCIFILVALCVTGWTLHSYTQHNAVPGWSSLMISVWLVGGVILVSLGIVGEYIGKIYIEVKDRPRYNEEELLMPSGKTE